MQFFLFGLNSKFRRKKKQKKKKKKEVVKRAIQFTQFKVF